MSKLFSALFVIGLLHISSALSTHSKPDEQPIKQQAISWQQFEIDTKCLADKLNETRKSWSKIVVITEEGIFAARLLSTALNIPAIEPVCIDTIIENSNSDILFIDVFADEKAYLELVRKKFPNAYITTVYVKPVVREFIDLYSKQVSQDTPIVFSWEDDFNY